eukprot:CAMPEP_0184009762 /NCGR_PEP_ID=MMETSP0954-20121128/2802_1 /TAXON_ID=627963 /ORGANISM="Aplanochytrium sp, Strain PBS07" /LENGTH=159 /DNA_ID=CAMNT_0026289205 /DNA_START=267 /DNA_END=742 /DNA_ORIENTATION=+
MLSQQLRAHRAFQPTPTSNNVQNVSQKQKPSLLFTPGEASTYNLRTIYEIGLNGLEELINIQKSALEKQKWVQYRDTLFTEAILSKERHLLSKDENDSIDITVNELLLELGPYWLMRATHKVTEFLVRHYHVHIYNAEALIVSVLPYHETTTFVKVVCL